MIEGLVSEILSRVLGNYIEDIDDQEVKVGIKRGRITLQNVHLARNLFHNFKIPLDAPHGVIKRLEMEIPWSDLLSKPLELQIDGVYILAQPHPHDSGWNQVSESQKQKEKQQKLQKYEEMKRNQRRGKESNSMADGVVKRILDQLQIRVSNIHVRLEVPHESIAAGFTLQELLFTSSTIQKESFVSKDGTVSGLGVYWNRDEQPHMFSNADSFVAFMEGVMRPQSMLRDYEYILNPVNIQLELLLPENLSDPQTPKTSIYVALDTLTFHLHEMQYNQILRVVKWLSQYNTREKKLAKIPSTPIVQDPLSHWQYIITEKLKAVRTMKHRFTSDFLNERRRLRIEYSAHWKEYILTKSLVKSGRLKELEEQLSYEDIAFFRLRAESEVRPEDLPSSTWSSWCLSWITSSGVYFPDEHYQTALSDQSLDLFYKNIGVSEASSQTFRSSKETNQLQQSIVVSCNDVNIILYGDNIEKVTLPIADITLHDISMNIRNWGDSYSMDIALQDAFVQDKWTENCQYPDILRRSERANEVENPVPGLDMSVKRLLSLYVKGDQDSVQVNLDLHSIDLVLNPRWIRRVSRCFSSLNSVDSDPQVGATFWNQLLVMRDYGMIHIRHAVESSKQILLHINIHSPRFLIPEEASDPNSAALIIGASSVQVSTKDRRPDPQNLGNAWQEHLYQEYQLAIQGFHMIIVTSADGIYLQNKASRQLPFWEDCDGEFSIEVLSGIDHMSDMPKVRVSALLPNTRVFLSGLIMRDFVRVMLAVVEDDIPPNFPPLVDPMDVEEPCAEDILDMNPITVYPKDYKSLNSRTFELHFALESASATILRDTIEPDGKMEVIARLITEGLVFQYQYRNLDMFVYFAAHSAVITDHFQNDGERFHFMASDIPEGAQFGHYDLDPAGQQEDNKKLEATPLITFYYERKGPRAPDYRKIQQELYISFKQLYVNFNRETAGALYEFINVGMMSDGKHKKQRQLLRLRRNGIEIELTKNEIKTLAEEDKSYELLLRDLNVSTGGVSDSRILNKRKPPAEDIFFHISVGVHRGSLVLNRDGHNYAALGLCKGDFDVFQKDDYMDVRCSLPSVLVEALHEKFHRSMLKINSFERPTMLVYRRYLRKYANYPGYTNKLFIYSSGVDLTVLQRFWFGMTDYLKELGSAYQDLKNDSVLPPPKEEKLSPKRKAEEYLRLELWMKETGLRLPRNSINPEYVDIHIHEGIIKNETFLMYNEDYEVYGERFTLDIASATGAVGDSLKDCDYPSLTESEMFLEYERAITDRKLSELPFIPFRVVASLPSLHIKATEHHYGTIVSAVMQGIDEYFLRSDPKENDTYVEDNDDDVGENKEDVPDEPEKHSEETEHRRYIEKQEKEEEETKTDVTPLGTTLALSVTIDTIYAEIIKEYDSDEDNEEKDDEVEESDDDTPDKTDLYHELSDYESDKEEQQADKDTFVAKVEEDSDTQSLKSVESDSDLEDDDDTFLSQALGILQGFEFTWISTKDNGVRMQIQVEELEVVDSRSPKKNKYPQLWSHGDLDGEPHFSYYYISDGKEHMKMSVEIKGLELIFIPLTYRVIAFFFTNPYVSISLPSELAASITQEDLITLDNPPLHRTPSKEDKTPNTRLLFFSDLEPSLKVAVSILDSTVIFPTNWKSRYSRGTVLSGALHIQTRSFRDIFGMSFSLSDVSAKVCYLPERETQATELISGFNVNYINTNVAEVVELILNMDPIEIKVTYRDLVSILGIINCVTPPDIQRDKHLSGSAHSEKDAISNIFHSMDIRTGGISVTLIDEEQGNIPIFCARAYAFTVNRDDAIKGDSKVAMKLQCDAYNRHLAAWEPFLEPWESVAAVNIMPLYGTNPPKSLTKIMFQSKEVLNINCSQYFYQLMQDSQKKWTDSSYLKSKEQTDYSTRNDLMILNHTGMKMTIFCSDDAHEMDIGESLFLADQVESALALQLHGGWKEIKHLPTHSIGRWIVGLHPGPANSRPCLLWHVKERDSHERIITVSSNVFIKNHCDMDIQVRLHLRGRGDVEFVLSPKDINPIPIQLSRSCQVYVRPRVNDDSYQWTSRSVDCLSLSPHTGLTHCPNQTGNDFYFLFDVRKSSHSGRKVIHFLPPIIIENLLTDEMKLNAWKHDSKNQTVQAAEIKQGESQQIFKHAQCEEMDISFSFGEYSECEKTHLIRSRSEDTFPTFWHFDKEDRPLLISSKKELNKHGCEVVKIYASYWLVNKTGMPLFYKRKAFRGHSRGTLAPGQETEQTIEEQKSLETLNVDTADQSSWYEDEEEKGIDKEPLMFSYASLDLFKPRTSVKIANSEWSKAVGLESIGTSGEIVANDEGTSVQYRLGVSIELLSEKYFRTKVITFRPRFILVNRTNREIYYTQEGTEYAHLLHKKQSLPFHWLDRDRPNSLSITFSPHHTWSGGFQIDEIGEFAVKIRSKEKMSVNKNSEYTSKLNYGSTYIARIEIQLHKATFFVIFKKQEDRVPPYQLENYTDLEIDYYQKIHGAEPQTLGPKSSVPYTWDNASGTHKLVIDIPKIHYRKIVKMDKIKSNRSEKITVNVNGKQLTYLGQVIAKGPTRILRIMEQKEDKDSKDSDLKLREGETDLDPIVTFQLFLNFKGIGISLVDSKPQEIVYISLLGLQMEYANSERHQSFEITLDDFQVDNQLHNATYPVLLSQSKRGKASHSKYLEDKFFHFCVIMSNFYKSINYFHYVSFLLQELYLRVDDKVVNTLLDFFGWEIGAIHESNFEAENEELMIEPRNTYRKLYIALLHINPMKCNITLRYTESDSDEQQSSKRNHVKNYLSTVRATISNIENAPLSLGSLLLENVFNTRPELVSRISKHYKQQLIWDIHKIIGSFDIIGNPVNLVTNLGTGVHDFFYEPIHGFVSSPKDFLDGLQKGSSSLAKNSVSGIFNTISELTGTLSRGVAHLTFDKEYMRQRQKDASDIPTNPAKGFGKGVKEFGKGVYKGLTGIVRTPYNDAKDQGPIGLVTGTGKGLVGAVVKPTVGLVDIAVRTTQGVKNVVEFEEKFDRVRLPRAFGPDRSIRTYNINEAVGQTILREVSSGIYSNDWYIFHSYPYNPIGVIIVSNEHILFVDCARDPFVSWECALLAIDCVEELRNSVVIHYNKIEDSNGVLEVLDNKQKRLRAIQFDFPNKNVTQTFYQKLNMIIKLIQRFELHQTEIVFSNKFIL